MGAASAVTDFVGDTVDTVGNAISDVGSFVDDSVRDVVPGGWKTVAAVTAATMGMPSDFGLTEGTTLLTEAETQAALDAASEEALSSWGTEAATGGLDSGLTTQVFDDGSSLITDSTGNIVSGMDTAGSAFTPEGYIDSGAPLGGTPEIDFGGSLANPTDVQKLLDYNAALSGGSLSMSDLQNAYKAYNMANQLFSGAPTTGTTGVRTTGTSGLTSLTDPTGGIANLTPGVTGGKAQADIIGLPNFATGGSTTYSPYSVSDLNNPKATYDPYGAPTAGSLKAGITGGKGGVKLSGLPGYLIKAADGGSIPEGHNPEFYSEGGLNNRYVKGKGDGTSDSVPAMLANGEFVIPADVVSGLGNGSNDAGAKILDEFMRVIRTHKQKHDAKKLPPDSKGPLAYLLQSKKQLGKK